MLFGDQSDFAVEIFHEPSSAEWKGFGRMCIHVQGTVIGRINEEHCSLFHAVARISEAAQVLPSLWDEKFSQHSDEEIFSWLDAVLYSGEVQGEQGLNRFDFLTNTGEQFDDSKTFILRSPDGVVRVLYFKDQRFGSASCRETTFVSVAARLSQWFKEQASERPYVYPCSREG